MALAPPRFLLIGALPLSLVNFRAPLLRALRDAGCEVHVAAAAIEADPATANALREMGVTAHSVPIARAGLNPAADLRALIALVQLMRRIKPTLILSYTIKPVVWGTLAGWLAGVPQRYAMITGLGYAFTGEAKGKRRIVQRISRTLYRIALARAHGVFFQNPDDLAMFRDFGLLLPLTPVTIVNGSGVDLAHYPPRPMPKGPLRFLMIARLLGDKGVREYVAAAECVRQTYPDASFHLVGGIDPNPNAISEAEVTRWAEEGHIVWHGEQADVRPFLAEAHVFVLPSYREGTPRTVLEALATGRPVITTDAPGCRETIEDGISGFLVAPQSVEQLTDAMFRILAAPRAIDGMGAKALERAREKYSAEKVTVVMFSAMGITDRRA